MAYELHHDETSRAGRGLRRSRLMALWMLALASGGCGDKPGRASTSEQPRIDAPNDASTGPQDAADVGDLGETHDSGLSAPVDAGEDPADSGVGLVEGAPLRLLVFYTPHGVFEDEWPDTTAISGEAIGSLAGTQLEALDDYRDDMLVLRGLALAATVPAGQQVDTSHAQLPGLLTAGLESAAMGFFTAAGPSFDHVLAQQLGAKAPVVLGVLSNMTQSNAVSFSAAGVPNLPENDPRLAYSSVLGKPAPSELAGLDPADDDDALEVASAQAIVAADALALGRSRVVTLSVLDALSQIDVSKLGVPLPASETSDVGYHYRVHFAEDDGRASARFVHRMFSHVLSQVLRRLAAYPEAGASALDHTIVLWLQDTGGLPASHQITDVPCMLIGRAHGKLSTGRTVRLQGRTQVDVLTTLAKLFGASEFGAPALAPSVIEELLAP